MRQGALRCKGTCNYRWLHLAFTVVTDSIVFASLWASSMATCHPGKAHGPFTIRALVHISTLKVLRQLSSFVRSVRSLNHTSLITWRFLPERYRYLQCAKAVLVCYTNRTALTTNLTFEEQRKRKSTINILQFYYYIRLLSRNRKTEDEVARIYPIKKIYEWWHFLSYNLNKFTSNTAM